MMPNSYLHRLKRGVALGAALVVTMASAQDLAVPRDVEQSIESGYFQRALTHLQPLLQRGAHSPQVQYRYGQALLGLNRISEARAILEAAIAAYPLDASLHRTLGETYGVAAQAAGPIDAFRLARSTLAEFIEALRLDHKDAEAHLDLAMFYIQAPGVVGGSLDKAHQEEAFLDKLAPVMALQARAAESQLGRNWPAAEAYLKQAAQLDRSSNSLTLLGQLYLDAGRASDALNTFRTIADKDPDNVAAWFWFGRAAALSRSHYAEGIDAMRHYLSLRERPDNAPSTASAQSIQAELCALTGQNACTQAELEATRRHGPGAGRPARTPN